MQSVAIYPYTSSRGWTGTTAEEQHKIPRDTWLICVSLDMSATTLLKLWKTRHTRKHKQPTRPDYREIPDYSVARSRNNNWTTVAMFINILTFLRNHYSLPSPPPHPQIITRRKELVKTPITPSSIQQRSDKKEETGQALRIALGPFLKERVGQLNHQLRNNE